MTWQHSSSVNVMWQAPPCCCISVDWHCHPAQWVTVIVWRTCLYILQAIEVSSAAFWDDIALTSAFERRYFVVVSFCCHIATTECWWQTFSHVEYHNALDFYCCSVHRYPIWTNRVIDNLWGDTFFHEHPVLRITPQNLTCDLLPSTVSGGVQRSV